MSKIKKILKVDLSEGYYKVNIKDNKEEEYSNIVFNGIEEYDSLNKSEKVQIKDRLNNKILKKEYELMKILLELKALKVEKATCEYSIQRNNTEKVIKNKISYLEKHDWLNKIVKTDDNCFIIENGLYKAYIESYGNDYTVFLSCNPLNKQLLCFTAVETNLEKLYNGFLYKFFNEKVDRYNFDDLKDIDEESLAIIRTYCPKKRIRE